MDEIQRQVQELKSRYSHNKDPLWKLLDEELGDAYNGELPSNLSVEFTKACFSRISPDEDIHDRLRRDAENYSEQWVKDNGPQKIHLKALRLLLCERVSRNKDDLIRPGPRVRLLSELIVAMRTADEWEQDGFERDDYLEDPPQRAFQAEPYIEDSFPFEDIYTSEFGQWIESQKSADDGDHAVYVLDCTPPVGDEERDDIRGLRGRVESKGVASLPRERAAEAANNDECVYYVGKTMDVVDRMELHDKGQSAGGAGFTELFKPNSVLEIKWHDTDKEARKCEKKTAERLTEPGGPYAFSETVDRE